MPLGPGRVVEVLPVGTAEVPPGEQAVLVERGCGSSAALEAELQGLLEGLAGEDLEVDRRTSGACSTRCAADGAGDPGYDRSAERRAP